MKTIFTDLESELNPLNGTEFDGEFHLEELSRLSRSRGPFLCELEAENGFRITFGVGPDFGCVQYQSNSGEPPYLMARAANVPRRDHEVEFACGGTATPVADSFILTIPELHAIVRHFVLTGERLAICEWDEI